MTRLQDIKVRISAASPGPWRALVGLRQYDPRFTNGVSLPMVLANNERALGEFAASMRDGDRALIVNAREDLEYLVAEVERLSAPRPLDVARTAAALAGRPVPAPHPDPASLEKENARLHDRLQAFIQTAWEAQAQVDKLLKEVKDLREQNEAMCADIQKWRTAAHAADQRMYNLAKDMTDTMERHGFFVERDRRGEK